MNVWLPKANQVLQPFRLAATVLRYNTGESNDTPHLVITLKLDQ